VALPGRRRVRARRGDDGHVRAPGSGAIGAPPRILRVVAAALDARGAPGRGAHLLVAVSGGPDSTALVAALAELRGSHGLAVTAAHVDHALRAESGAEAESVAALCARLGVTCERRRVEVPRGGDLEARARRARYRALREVAAAAGAEWIVTGHTLDDQAETVLLRLLRGAGRRGLGAMAPVRGRLFRPLLGATRADVRRFLADRELPFVVDRSNADLAHTRNRVRRLLVPLLEAEFNPRLRAALGEAAARLADEDAFLDALARPRLEALAREGRLSVEVAGEPFALARRIIRMWLGRGGVRRIDGRHVESVLALAAGGAPGSAAVPGPARVVREGRGLVLRAGREARSESFCLDIVPGVGVRHPAQLWRLALGDARPRRPDEDRAIDAEHALFDADLLPAAGLVVRPPRPGDRIRLLSGGSRKIQDVLVDAKVPRESRAAVPLLVAEGQILWVAGVVRGAMAALGPSTRRVVEGVLERGI
jgi:tRNA(Ile)-lysidine synthase